MTARAYYNEIDPFAAEWLRNLIVAGHITPGDVDTRSIEDVTPDDLRGYTQCHFFAGIGVWSYSLRRAGWDDGRPVWTGSCPCQPFSAAGKRGGTDDERHLWPAFFHLIDACRPSVVFGEQVASKDGLAWLDTVQADMEGAGYAFRAADLCAACVGAPHIRQRLYFVGASDTPSGRWGEECPDSRRLARGSGAQGIAAGYSSSSSIGGMADDEGSSGGSRLRDFEPTGRRFTVIGDGNAASRMDDHHHQGSQGHAGDDGAAGRSGPERPTPEASVSGGVGHDHDQRSQGGILARGGAAMVVAGTQSARTMSDDRPGPTNGQWRHSDWLLCRDGKWRPVESGTFPLVNGAPSRVGRLRAYGNAIVSEVAVEFIGAVVDVLSGRVPLSPAGRVTGEELIG